MRRSTEPKGPIKKYLYLLRTMDPNNGGIAGEFYFYELLRQGAFEGLRKRFDRFRIHSVLDVGCGDGRALIGMHYRFGCTVLHGCDTKSANGVLNSECLSYQPTYLWEAHSSIASELFGDNRGERERRRAVYGLLNNVQYETEFGSYSINDKYDALICSHVLHFMKNAEQVGSSLRRIGECKHENSMVYLSVKDNFKHKDGSPVIPGDELMTLCSKWSTEIGLTYSPSHNMSVDEGQAHVFTNL